MQLIVEENKLTEGLEAEGWSARVGIWSFLGGGMFVGGRMHQALQHPNIIQDAPHNTTSCSATTRTR